ncbi:50S ribosomal protein L7ae [Candidatus Woesearchaeota archaeon]|nr:50S ribosomal protein L7ae [Candidatus Woesearchaeota archaeon]
MEFKEVSKETTKRALEAVEIAKKTGKVKKGINEVTKTIERGQAKLVVVATDVNPKEIIMHLPLLCKEKNIPLIPVPSRQELGLSAGLSVPTSAVAIIKEGDSKDIIKELNK